MAFMPNKVLIQYIIVIQRERLLMLKIVSNRNFIFRQQSDTGVTVGVLGQHSPVPNSMGSFLVGGSLGLLHSYKIPFSKIKIL